MIAAVPSRAYANSNQSFPSVPCEVRADTWYSVTNTPYAIMQHSAIYRTTGGAGTV